MFRNIFSFEGRIRRTEYAISFVLYIAITLIIVLAMDNGGAEGKLLSFLLRIPFLWFLWAQGCKRCHDLNTSGWYQIIPLYFLWLLFADGQPYPNEYGENPKGLDEQEVSADNIETEASEPHMDPNIRIRK